MIQLIEIDVIMNEAWSENGQWWLPGSPQQRAAGLLSFDPKRGAEIKELAGGWVGLQGQLQAGLLPPAPPVIIGRAHSAALYTCLSNFYLNLSHRGAQGGGQIIVADIDVRTLFKNRHFATGEEAIFRRCSCNYSNLHSWLFGMPDLAVHEVPNEDRTYQVQHNREVLWECLVEGGFRLTNDFLFSHRVSFRPDTHVTFRHFDGLLLTTDHLQNFDEFFKAEHKFRSLVNFLGDFQLEIRSVKCNAAADGGPGEVECYDTRMVAGFSEREDARPGVTPLPYSDIAANFNLVLQRWFELHGQLGPIVNLYLFGKQNRQLDLNNIFLGLMQGLERYHRSFHGGFFMPQAEYDANVRPVLDAAIPDNIHGSFRQRLKSAIQYGYEFSLRRRLNDLIAEIPNTATFNEVREPAFVSASVDTRNSLTHQTANPDMHIFSDSELYNAINMWREALFALVASRLGIAADSVDLAVRRLQARRASLIAL